MSKYSNCETVMSQIKVRVVLHSGEVVLGHLFQHAANKIFIQFDGGVIQDQWVLDSRLKSLEVLYPVNNTSLF
jgi:hypothetical protein